MYLGVAMKVACGQDMDKNKGWCFGWVVRHGIVEMLMRHFAYFSG